MAQQFSGTVQILNTSSGSPTVVLEGGDDESGGNLNLGGQGQSGDLTLLDESSRQRLFASANGSRPFLRLENETGVSQIILEGDTGNIIIQGKLFFGGLGGIELNGATIQTLLQATQTVNAFAQRIQNFENREQVLMQQVSSLTQQVNSLTGRIIALEQQGSPSGNPSSFVISVVTDQGQFVVTGSGFRRNVKCFIIVVYPDLTRKVLEDTADRSGELNFKVNTSSLCIAGLNLTLNFTVNQPDASGRDKFTNTVSKSCPA